jgi:glycosyltransferase involved in cell wall biosynthesis
LKIFAIHDPYAPIENGSVGGEDNLAQLQIDSMRNLGHDVFDARFSDTGVARKLNQMRAQILGTGADIQELVYKFKPDVIHTLNLSQRTGYAWMRDLEIPIVSSIHNFRLFCPSSIAWRSGSICLECRDGSAWNGIKHRCAGLVGVANASRHLVFQPDYPQVKYPTLFLFASENMKKVFNTLIPQEKMRVLRTPSDSGKPEQNLEITRSGWLYAGRLSQEKGVLDLIDAWPEGENLDIAGSGPLANVINKRIASKANIAAIGTYPPGDRSIFRRYEGMIFPSTWFEGSPLVVMECLGTGTPVICGSVSSAAEQIQITKGGYVFEGRITTQKITEAILNVRDKFQFYSHNAATNTLKISSVDNWKLDLEKYLLEAIKLYN